MSDEMPVHEWNDLARSVIYCPKCGGHIVVAERQIHQPVEVRRKNGSLVGRPYDSHSYTSYHGPDDYHATLTCKNKNCAHEWPAPLLVVSAKDKAVALLEKLSGFVSLRSYIPEIHTVLSELKKE